MVHILAVYLIYKASEIETPSFRNLKSYGNNDNNGQKRQNI